MKSDKLLFGIVIVIAVIAIFAIAVFAFRAPPDYINENTPEAVVHNLILAINNEDYKKAFGYSYSGKDYDEFRELMLLDRGYARDIGVLIMGSYYIDDENARVEVLISSGSNDLLGRAYQYTETALLILDANDGLWKVQEMNPYFYLYDYEIKEAVPAP